MALCMAEQDEIWIAMTNGTPTLVLHAIRHKLPIIHVKNSTMYCNVAQRLLHSGDERQQQPHKMRHGSKWYTTAQCRLMTTNFIEFKDDN